MSTKHTPGPWRAVETQTGTRILIYAQNGKYIALAHHGGNVNWKPITNLEEALANTLLIAAAPELLEALKKARQTLWECAQDTIGTPTEALFRQEVAKCDAVIAKAEGTD